MLKETTEGRILIKSDDSDINVGFIHYCNTPPERMMDYIPDKEYYEIEHLLDNTVYLSLICIHGPYTGNGYAKAALVEFIEKMKRDRFMSIILSAMPEEDPNDLERLSKLYESVGFNHVSYVEEDGIVKANIMIIEL